MSALRQYVPDGHLLTRDSEAMRQNLQLSSVNLDEAQMTKPISREETDLFKLNFEKSNPLYVACYHSQEEAGLCLIQQGCSVNTLDVSHRLVNREFRTESERFPFRAFVC